MDENYDFIALIWLFGGANDEKFSLIWSKGFR